MARFDVCRNPDGPGYLLDCQADLFSNIDTRLVVPLLPIEAAPPRVARLNPIFEISGQPHMMLTQSAAAVPVHILPPAITSLAAQDFTIINAWDMLLTGI